ncbi:MAG: hypothetical protein JWQ40_5102 [Segetibacter sp.]|nr:hypothetical protein [Segetibacter sp.]
MQELPLLKPDDKNDYDSKNETISELAHRHLTDENHTTSDEELMNAKVELSSDAKGDNENGAEAADADDTLSGISPVPNPYDVVSS